MATQDESFTVTTGDGSTYTVGGSAPTSTTFIQDRFGFADDQDQAEFHWRFVVEATGYSDLATKCAAMEAALRQRYSKLVVKFASTTLFSFDPAVAASTGWDLEPSLKKVDGWPNTGLAQAYDYRARVALPPNFTDAYGAADGRRSADANYHTDPNELPVVTLRGVWTQVVGSLARPQYISQIDAYANYRLTLIDPTAQWTITRREESDPQSLSTLTWTREFSQVTNGRRGTTRDPVIQSNGLRLTTVRGTYLNTYGVSPQTALQNYNADAATWVNTTLAAITTLEGGPMVIGQGCEVISQTTPANSPQQNQRVDFTWVVRELRVPQSTNTNFLDDPNITNDSITMVIRHNPLADSPAPTAVQQNAGAASSPPTTGTQTRDAPSPPGGKPGTTDAGAGTPVVKPIDVFARYEATFKASVASLQGYYEQYVRPQLEFEFGAALGVTPVVMVNDQASFDIQNCKVSSEIHAQAFPGALIALKVTQSIHNATGLHFDGVFNGQPFNFDVQPGLPDRIMVRKIAAFYKTGSGFSLSQFQSQPWAPGQTGWVLFDTSEPDIEVVVQGIPALGYSPLSFTKASLVESLRWVAANAGTTTSTNPPSGAATTTGGGGNNNATTTSGGPGGPVDVPAPTPTGVGDFAPNGQPIPSGSVL